jgi:DNA-binding FrmR family transcriptional regulator
MIRPLQSPKSQKSSPPNAGCETGHTLPHPDHSAYLPRLNRVQGQLAGIEKMIGDGRYCVDILVQFRAVMAALRAVEVKIFEKHLEHCVSAALRSQDEKKVEEKIRELTELLARRTSL